MFCNRNYAQFAIYELANLTKKEMGWVIMIATPLVIGVWKKGKQRAGRWAGWKAGRQGAQYWGCMWILNRGCPISAGHQNELMRFYCFPVMLTSLRAGLRACSECAYARSKRSHNLQKAPEGQAFCSPIWVRFCRVNPHSLSAWPFPRSFRRAQDAWLHCLISHVTKGLGARHRIQIHRSSLFRKRGLESDSTITPILDEYRKEDCSLCRHEERTGRLITLSIQSSLVLPKPSIYVSDGLFTTIKLSLTKMKHAYKW